jgi:uncharacterized protein (TIGR01777 family)
MGLSRDPSKASGRAPDVQRFFAWTPDQLPPMEAIESADVVINLAGETVNGRWTAAKKRRVRDSRLEGTRNLVAAMSCLPASKTLISTSAVGFYGNRGDEELTEASAQGEGFLSELTRYWEIEALRARDGGHRVAVVRIGIVMGPEGGALAKMVPLFRFGLGGPLGNGRQWWPWVHVDDVVEVLTTAIRSDWQGVYNLSAPNPVRQSDFARELGKAMSRPSFAPVPDFVLRLVQGEFADEVLFSKRVMPARLLDAGYRFAHPEISAALANLLGKEAEGAAIPTGA